MPSSGRNFPPGSIRAAVAALGDNWQRSRHVGDRLVAHCDAAVIRQFTRNWGHMQPHARQLMLASAGLNCAEFISFINDIQEAP